MRKLNYLSPGEKQILQEIIKLSHLLPQPLITYSRALGDMRDNSPQRPPVTQARTIRASKG